MTAAPLPSWLVPPPEGYTAEDLDRIPDLPPHTELIDGSLVFVSPQMLFRVVVVDGLNSALGRLAPSDLFVTREMTVTLGRRQRPEPDLAVITRASITSMDDTDLKVDAVHLVVEVVSPESEIRDRERKPQLYAQAGIPHFWRVENEDQRPVVHVYRLNPATAAYDLVSVERERLLLTEPFPIDVDLTEIVSFGR